VVDVTKLLFYLASSSIMAVANETFVAVRRQTFGTANETFATKANKRLLLEPCFDVPEVLP
jgi:hypothetical protein